MLKSFICPDGGKQESTKCLRECRMVERCLTLPTLSVIAEQRPWNGVPSTTQLLNGTMYEFLKLTQPYDVDPDSRAFMLAGTKHHEAMESMAKQLNLPAEVAMSIDRDIFDLLEPDSGGWSLTDYKLWGSYKVAKAIGLVETGKQPDPTGAVYKRSGTWGKAGSPKMISVYDVIPEEADNWEAEMQLNRYRVMLEKLNVKVTRMQLQVTVRDGGTSTAEGRGITRNFYRIPIPRMDDDEVVGYFLEKEANLALAMVKKEWHEPCSNRENWDGVRCKDYCEVALYCPAGLIHMEPPDE